MTPNDSLTSTQLIERIKTIFNEYGASLNAVVTNDVYYNAAMIAGYSGFGTDYKDLVICLNNLEAAL